MSAPAVDSAVVLALSFVRGLAREPLYAALRSLEAEVRNRTSSESDVRNPRATTPSAATSDLGRRTSDDPVVNLLARLGCADAAQRAELARRRADRACARAHALGITPVCWGDPRYPPLVAGIFDPPLVLWVRGSIEALSLTSIAIVGSRSASPYGEDAASRLASDLVRRGLAIISGLARGIDASAHRGALAAGGVTIGVLGCGPDIVYPPEHKTLMEEVARTGAVISELPPGTPPRTFQFPRRNRIISALSRGVVVVEARQRSGALITADCALEQGREVMAVPGNVLSERHRGSHALLKAGAAVVENADDVLAAAGLDRAQTGDHVRDDAHPGGSDIGRRISPLLALMESGESYTADDLASVSGCGVAALLPQLLDLELQGFLRRMPGGRFVRSGRTC